MKHTLAWAPCGAAVMLALWAGLSLVPTPAAACGACAEDAAAAVYDHAVARQAAARSHVVVVCGVRGAVDASRLQSVARGTPGVQPQSVRVASQPAALSFVIASATLSPTAAVAAMQRALGPAVQLQLIQARTPATHPTLP